MIRQVGSTVGSETGVNNWTDSADTSLALESSEGATPLSDLKFSLASNVHVQSNGQRADSVVEG
jgi:hypothetical protein